MLLYDVRRVREGEQTSFMGRLFLGFAEFLIISHPIRHHQAEGDVLSDRRHDNASTAA